MGVVSYVDALPGQRCEDYRNGFFANNGNDSIDIKAANFTTMDAGLPVYAAAGGTVTNVVDGNFDSARTQPTAIPPTASPSITAAVG